MIWFTNNPRNTVLGEYGVIQSLNAREIEIQWSDYVYEDNANYEGYHVFPLSRFGSLDGSGVNLVKVGTPQCTAVLLTSEHEYTNTWEYGR